MHTQSYQNKTLTHKTNKTTTNIKGHNNLGGKKQGECDIGEKGGKM